MRELVVRTGVTTASLYNAFGDKRALYRQALDHYVEMSVGERIRRLGELPPRAAIEGFFAEIVRRSLGDPEQKGCMLVNAALEVAPHDDDFKAIVAAVLVRLEGFFRDRVTDGQAAGTISRTRPAAVLARHLLSVLMGVRVLARVRPEPMLLKDAVAPAMALLDEPAATSTV